MTRCNSEETHAIDYLQVIVVLKLNKLFENQNSLQTMLTNLVKQKYLQNQIEQCSRRLTRLFQYNYHDIKGFSQVIESVLIRWAARCDTTASEIQSKCNSTFMQELNDKTRTFMDIHNLNSSQDIFTKINNIERNLITRLTERIKKINNNFTNNTHKQNNVKYRTQNISNYSLKNYSSQDNKTATPWCAYHKCYGNRTRERRTLKQKNESQKREQKISKASQNH